MPVREKATKGPGSRASRPFSRPRAYATRRETAGLSAYNAVEFTAERDSPLEGDGFELLVPRHESPRFPKHPGMIVAPTI